MASLSTETGLVSFVTLISFLRMSFKPRRYSGSDNQKQPQRCKQSELPKPDRLLSKAEAGLKQTIWSGCGRSPGLRWSVWRTSGPLSVSDGPFSPGSRTAPPRTRARAPGTCRGEEKPQLFFLKWRTEDSPAAAPKLFQLLKSCNYYSFFLEL